MLKARKILVQKEQIESEMMKVLSRVSGISEVEIKPSARLNEDLGIDSFSALDLAHSFEERFLIPIEDQELRKLKTVDDILTFISRKLKAP